MNVDDIRPHPLGHLGLIFEFVNRLLDHVLAWRIQHDELIGMKNGADTVLGRELTAATKRRDDRFRIPATRRPNSRPVDES